MTGIPPVLEAFIRAQDPSEQGVFLDILKGTYPEEGPISAEAIAGVLRKHGYQASASTIRGFRRSIKKDTR